MATLRIDGHELVVELSGLEKAGAMRGNVRVPRAAIRDVKAVDDATRAVRGLRAPGTGWPGRIALGTWRRRHGKDFVAADGHGPGVVVELEDARYARLIISSPDAGRLASELAARV